MAEAYGVPPSTIEADADVAEAVDTLERELLATRTADGVTTMDEPKTPPEQACPWCPETRPTLKQLLMHMESAHHARWCNLALYPPVAGGKPI